MRVYYLPPAINVHCKLSQTSLCRVTHASPSFHITSYFNRIIAQTTATPFLTDSISYNQKQPHVNLLEFSYQNQIIFHFDMNYSINSMRTNTVYTDVVASN